MILSDCQAKDEIGNFGLVSKLRHCAAFMGLFNSAGKLESKIRAPCILSSTYEWQYLACGRKWTQVARVAVVMFRDKHARNLLGMAAAEAKCAISV